MDSSIPLKALILLSCALVLGAFALSFIIDARFRRLVRWIETHHPQEWSALPWTLRKVFRGAAIEGLRHRALHHDRHFLCRYGDIQRLHRWMVTLLVLGAIAIGLALFGSQYDWWTW